MSESSCRRNYRRHRHRRLLGGRSCCKLMWICFLVLSWVSLSQAFQAFYRQPHKQKHHRVSEKIETASLPLYAALSSSTSSSSATGGVWQTRNATFTWRRITSTERDKPSFSFWRRRSANRRTCQSPLAVYLSYQYDELQLTQPHENDNENRRTVGMILIHPIGVGISKWFYHRLLTSLSEHYSASSLKQNNLHILVPDLIASGSACNATVLAVGDKDEDIQIELPRPWPLLNISDWSEQVLDLMTHTTNNEVIDEWVIVANGGCSPIALQVAARTNLTISRIVLSSVPRLPFFTTRGSEPHKVKKSYKRLANGILGKLFWWYALRKDGKFIQRFSERNLVASSQNLGPEWTPNCVANAKNYNSRYSTFSFLVGCLQDGCVESLEQLLQPERNKNVATTSTTIIDIIQGRDVRRNQARSVFWQRRRKSQRKVNNETSESSSPTSLSFRDWLEERDMLGSNRTVGGRVSLAYEDPDGYAKALLELL